MADDSALRETRVSDGTMKSSPEADNFACLSVPPGRTKGRLVSAMPVAACMNLQYG